MSLTPIPRSTQSQPLSDLAHSSYFVFQGEMKKNYWDMIYQMYRTDEKITQHG